MYQLLIVSGLSCVYNECNENKLLQKESNFIRPCTLCSEKNTHSCFLIYLHGKCLDYHQIFRECLGGNKYSISRKVKYSLLLVTLCWRHISVFVNYGFYRQKQAFEKCLLGSKGYGATSSCKMFLNNRHTIECWWNKTLK